MKAQRQTVTPAAATPPRRSGLAVNAALLTVLVTLLAIGCETTPKAKATAEVAAALQAGEAVQVMPRHKLVEPFIVLDAQPTTIIEMASSQRFLVGTVNADGVRLMDDEGAIANFQNFDDQPAPAASAWWGDRYAIGFANHGRVLVGDLAGMLQYIDTPASAVHAMTTNSAGELIVVATQPGETAARGHAMLVLDRKSVRRIVPLYFEPTGITAGTNGDMLISDASSIYRVTPAGKVTRMFRGLDSASQLTRLNATTLLFVEQVPGRAFFGAKIVALNLTTGRRTTVVDGLTRISDITLASDGTLWFTEPGNTDQPASSIYRMRAVDLASALERSTVWEVSSDVDRHGGAR